MARMPSASDDAFARRLFAKSFQKRVGIASKPIFPTILAVEREDIIQETLIHAYEKRDQFRGETDKHLLGWVLVILRNRVRDILDARELRPTVDRLPENLERDASTPGEAMVSKEKEPRLPKDIQRWVDTARGVLGLLAAADREVLLLRQGYGLSVAETAELLSRNGKPVTEAAVKMRHCRALKRINELAGRLHLEGKVPKAASTDSAEENA